VSEIFVYTFEMSEGQDAGSWSTQDYQEAQDYARKHGLRVISNTYEWQDSELLDDYTGKGS